MSAGALVIDHDSLLRSSLKDRLKQEGYRVFLSDQPAEVGRLIRRKRIDVVLLSLAGLKREGLMLLSLIKELRPWIQVILINRSEQIGFSIEGMNKGAFDDFLLPFNMNDLMVRLKDAVLQTQKQRGTKKSWRRKLDDMMIAVSFAEAGEVETARQYLDRPHHQPDGDKSVDKQ